VVVGDDSVASVRATRGDSPISIDCISDGGKSALALLLDKKLPGLEALRGTLT
jgi:3-phosphoglycerate kinase